MRLRSSPMSTPPVLVKPGSAPMPTPLSSQDRGACRFLYPLSSLPSFADCASFALGSISLVIRTPSASFIADDFNNHDRFLSVFFLAVPNLDQVVSPLYIGPLFERYGRVPVCHLFNLLFIAFTIIGGSSHNFATLIVSKFLSGFSIFSICLNTAITGDLFAKHELGTAMSLASMTPILGSAMGPILGVYVTQYLSWHWTCWLVSIGAAALTSVMAVTSRSLTCP
ncbi:hypothetical protein PG996_006154 [Apiospora saccharicola]|uniref:Major facilitator superfamily (MFS) profile domain-containing protein n=1 Tax=Apiospora saccharicola TaxID=335842 RepID=A0ABR1VNI5_9PEZI